jgi:hypothetical protein
MSGRIGEDGAHPARDGGASRWGRRAFDRRAALRVLGGIVAVAAAGAASGARGEGPDGMIGAPLASVAATVDFFTFFHLQRVAGPADLAAAGAFDFRPSGEAFGALARVHVVTDEQGAIAGMSVALMRSFIDDPAKTTFARDIAKSFLIDAPPRQDAALLADLADDIEKRRKSGATLIVGPHYQPAVGDPSPEYAVFTGDSQTPARRALRRTDFSIAPTTEDDKPALIMAIELRRG